MKSKKIICIISLTYLLILFPVNLMSQDLFTAKEELTVFKKASVNSDSIYTIHSNDEVEVLEIKKVWFKKWAKIQNTTGEQGYVLFHDLKPIDTNQKTQENNTNNEETSTQNIAVKDEYSEPKNENTQDIDNNQNTIGESNQGSESTSNIDETSNPVNETTNNKNAHNIFDDFDFYLICFIVLILLVISYRYRRKCRSCKKWGAMKRIGSEKVGEKQSHVKKTEQTTDIIGEKHSNTYYIPATISYYHIHRKCKYCGYRDILEKTEKTEN